MSTCWKINLNMRRHLESLRVFMSYWQVTKLKFRIDNGREYLVVVVVRIDCSDQLSRDEVTSLTYSSPLRVNVSASVYFFQVQVQLTLERVVWVNKCNVLWQIIAWDGHSVENKWVLVSFTEVRWWLKKIFVNMCF